MIHPEAHGARRFYWLIGRLLAHSDPDKLEELCAYALSLTPGALGQELYSGRKHSRDRRRLAKVAAAAEIMLGELPVMEGAVSEQLLIRINALDRLKSGVAEE